MKIRILKVLVFAYLCVSSINCKSSTLQQLLSAYCVPTNESGCVGEERATFTGTTLTLDAVSQNYCQCSVEDFYYDKKTRGCKLCEDGTYNRDNLATTCKSVCALGSMYVKVENCPVGYFKSVDF